MLRAACVRTGSRDPDDLWDHLYEVDYQRVATEKEAPVLDGLNSHRG
jgi:hypothetical protein